MSHHKHQLHQTTAFIISAYSATHSKGYKKLIHLTEIDLHFSIVEYKRYFSFQRWAMAEGYGACLINKPELVQDMVRHVRNQIDNPGFSVSIKIRYG